MSGTRVRVHIDRLVLRGIDPLDRQGFVSGFETELARVVGNRVTLEALERSARTPVMRLGTIPMPAGPAGARSLGKGVARAIAKGTKP